MVPLTDDLVAVHYMHVVEEHVMFTYSPESLRKEGVKIAKFYISKVRDFQFWVGQ